MNYLIQSQIIGRYALGFRAVGTTYKPTASPRPSSVVEREDMAWLRERDMQAVLHTPASRKGWGAIRGKLRNCRGNCGILKDLSQGLLDTRKRYSRKWLKELIHVL